MRSWVPALRTVFRRRIRHLHGGRNVCSGNSRDFFAGNVHYIAGSLNTWGWVVLCIGVAEWIVGTGVFVKSQFSRWVGVVVLGVNSIVQLMMIPAYPFWSLSVFTLDILAIFGLLAYGARISNAD